MLDGGRVVAAGTPAELAAGAIARLRFRLDRPLDEGDAASLQAAIRASGPTRRSVPTVTGLATGSMGAPPDASLVAAVAAWCAG